MSVINKYIRFAALVALLFGIAFTIFGLGSLKFPLDLPWQDNTALMRYVGLCGFLIILIVLLSKQFKQGLSKIGVVLGLSVFLLSGALWSFLVVLWFFLSAYLLGSRVLKKINFSKIDENEVEKFLVGAGIYGSIVGLIAHFPINFPGVYFIALSLPLILDRKVAKDYISSILSRISNHENYHPVGYWINVFLIVIGLVYIVIALLPEVGYDPLVTHLFVPTQLSDRHLWGYDSSLYALAVIPMLADWIYAINYMLGGESASRLVNVGFIFILSFLVRDLVMWAGGSKISSNTAALLFLSTPLTFLEASTLHVEGVWAAFMIGATLSIFRLIESEGKKDGFIISSGLLLGFSLATKAITFLALPVILSLALLRWRYWAKQHTYKIIFVSLCAFLLFGVMPYFNAWILTGNPVFPFFNKIFQSPFFPIENFKDMRWQLGVTTDILYAITFHSERYLEARAGAPGFQWLIFLVPAFIILIIEKSKRGFLILLIGFVSLFLIFEFTATYLRYVYPAAILLIVAIVLSIDKAIAVGNFIEKITYSSGLILALSLNFIFLNSASWYGDFEIRSVFDPLKREEYIAKRLPIRAAVDLVNKLNRRENPIAFISEPSIAGIKSDALVISWHNYKFRDAFLKITSNEDALSLLLDQSVEFVILDKNLSAPTGFQKVQSGYIESITVEVAVFGSISVRKIDEKLIFRKELLTNVDFETKDAWSFSEGTAFDRSTNSVIVNETYPVTQSVIVKGGRKYKNSVLARCLNSPTKGRVQINWHDVTGRFIRADGITFDCSPDWSEHQMIVVAPRFATKGIVYTSGHTMEKLNFKRNSLLE